MHTSIATSGGAAGLGLLVVLAACQLGDLINPPSSSGALLISPARIAEEATAGSTTPLPHTLKVARGGTGNGTVQWTATRAGDSAWVSLNRASGSTPDSVTVELNPAGLEPNLYRETILFIVAQPPDTTPVLVELRIRASGTTATRLVFATPPGDADVGAPITPAVRVRAVDDAGDHVTSFAGDITVAKKSGPGNMGGTPTRPAEGGVATFSDLSFDAPGTYTLEASAAGLDAVTSGTFTIRPTGGATRLVFTRQPPTTVTAGQPITPPVEVTARDPQGQPVTTFTGLVRLALSPNPAGAVLSGNEANAAGGAAVFSNLQVDRAGAYVLVATATGVEPGTSDLFTVLPAGGSGNTLVFTEQPRTTTAGQPITPAIKVTARDAQGNTITSFTGNVHLEIAEGPSGVTLGGSVDTNAAAGVATFTNVKITRAASGYKLKASSDGFAPATSASFAINPAAPDHAVFVVQPTNTPVNRPITPAVQVAVHDHFGNVATSFTTVVYMSIANDGSLLKNAKLDPGGTQRAASAGVATFEDLKIDQVGTAYTLLAAPGNLKDGISAPFNVTLVSSTSTHQGSGRAPRVAPLQRRGRVALSESAERAPPSPLP